MKQQGLTTCTQGISTDLQAFEHEVFGRVRGVEIGGVPWLVGKDIAAALGYKRAAKAIQDHVDAEDKDVVPIEDTIGRRQKTSVINESGVYDLVLSSELPQARAFRRWVTATVLPSIRRHGAYITPDKLTELEADPAALGRLAAQLRSEVAALTPKAAFYDRVLENRDVLSVTAIALELGMSARALNSRLEELGVQYRAVGGGWIPAKEHINKARVTAYCHNSPDDVLRTHTMWTQAGRRFIKNLLSSKGAL